MKRNEIIKAIGDKIIEKLFELDDNYTYEGDPEFGGFEATINCYCIEFKHGTGECEVEATVTYPYRGSEIIEVALYPYDDKNLDNVEKAVSDYVKENLETQDLLDAMFDKIRGNEYDEWDEHGFRSAQDYYNYRYAL